MTTVIIARCGLSDTKNSKLTPAGQAQIRDLATRVSKNLDGPIIILSSDAKRAQETTAILKIFLPLTTAVETSDVLRSGYRIQTRLKSVYAIFKEKLEHYDTIIIVTHLEYTEQLPRYLRSQLFSEKGLPDFRGFHRLCNGEALVMDSKITELYYSLKPYIQDGICT